MVYFTYLSSNLVAALTGLNVDDFSHDVAQRREIFTRIFGCKMSTIRIPLNEWKRLSSCGARSPRDKQRSQRRPLPRNFQADVIAWWTPSALPAAVAAQLSTLKSWRENLSNDVWRQNSEAEHLFYYHATFVLIKHERNWDWEVMAERKSIWVWLRNSDPILWIPVDEKLAAWQRGWVASRL